MWGLTMWLAILAAVVLLVRPLLHQQSKFGSLTCHILLALPFFALASRFLTNDTSFAHVVSYGGEDLPLRYRFAATWAAREGPLLLWVMWMTLLAYVWRNPMEGEHSHSSQSLRLRLIHGFNLLILLLAWNLDPFKASTGSGMGQGLNELLQTDLMVIHPPLIFLAYSFCLHISCVALSSMFTDANGIQKRMLSIVRPGLLISTLGIGLGGLWAYLILDWGGYWAWDPVETGSMLPWLALVFMAHLRTRPGKTSNKTWIGAGIAAGGLAFFATLVTRAGGVWASSVHTFVTDSAGTSPTDAFSRMMLLKSDGNAGVEVISYLVVLLLFIGFWLQLQRSGKKEWKPHRFSLGLFSLPLLGVIIALLLNIYNDIVCSEKSFQVCTSAVDTSVYATVPSLAFTFLLFAPLAVEFYYGSTENHPADKGWSFLKIVHRGDRTSPQLLFLALVLVFFTVLVFTENFLYTAFFLIFFTPLFLAEDATKMWAHGAAGVMLGLAGAWSGLIEVLSAGLIMLLFILPWLFVDETEEDSRFSFFEKKTQQRLAMWASVLVVGMYLILTIVLLLSGIDSINFEGHELYGTPFVMALASAFFLYSNRRHDAKRNASLLLVTLLFSLLLAIWQPTAFGMDSSTAMSSLLVRGVLAWLTLPVLILVVIPMLKEVVVTQGIERPNIPIWKRIPFGAHLVHIGLLLLLIGHAYTTVLVDRGDASHRVTMVKDEVVLHGNYGYEFTGLRLTSENLEVGDGYVGIQIDVYEINQGGIGERIGTVEPGMLRFDTTTDSGFVLQSTSRSEVDTLTRWSGDIVFIFDGSQANGLMQQTAQNGSDSVQIVRVTIYDLPASHLVWLGWSTMLLGMGVVVLGGMSKNGRRKDIQRLSKEEE
tara:strand:+ start:6827 stop:9454 length:2628 start_codon:yes stop_codon:yes gene_type:complete